MTVQYLKTVYDEDIDKMFTDNFQHVIIVGREIPVHSVLNTAVDYEIPWIMSLDSLGSVNWKFQLHCSENIYFRPVTSIFNFDDLIIFFHANPSNSISDIQLRNGGQLIMYAIRNGNLVWAFIESHHGVSTASQLSDGNILISFLNNESTVILNAADGVVISQTQTSRALLGSSHTQLSKVTTLDLTVSESFQSTTTVRGEWSSNYQFTVTKTEISHTGNTTTLTTLDFYTQQGMFANTAHTAVTYKLTQYGDVLFYVEPFSLYYYNNTENSVSYVGSLTFYNDRYVIDVQHVLMNDYSVHYMLKYSQQSSATSRYSEYGRFDLSDVSTIDCTLYNETDHVRYIPTVNTTKMYVNGMLTTHNHLRHTSYKNAVNYSQQQWLGLNLNVNVQQSVSETISVHTNSYTVFTPIALTDKITLTVKTFNIGINECKTIFHGQTQPDSKSKTNLTWLLFLLLLVCFGFGSRSGAQKTAPSSESDPSPSQPTTIKTDKHLKAEARDAKDARDKKILQDINDLQEGRMDSAGNRNNYHPSSSR